MAGAHHTQGEVAICGKLPMSQVPQGQVHGDSLLGHQTLPSPMSRSRCKAQAEQKGRIPRRRTRGGGCGGPPPQPSRDREPTGGTCGRCEEELGAAWPPSPRPWAGHRKNASAETFRGGASNTVVTREQGLSLCPGEGHWQLCGHQANPEQGSLCRGGLPSPKPAHRGGAWEASRSQQAHPLGRVLSAGPTSLQLTLS